MRKSLIQLCFLLALLVSHGPRSEELPLTVPLFDLPFNLDAPGDVPSMPQSLNWTKSFYQGTHYLALKTWGAKHPRKTVYGLIAFDFLTTWTPLGTAWVHEEWHRAVMGRHGIESYDDVLDFPFFAEVIAVSHVKDEDLIALKRDHPADMIRMHAAGLEAQYELNLALERDRFFSGIDTFNGFLLWVNHVNSIGYTFACASDEANRITRDALAREDDDIRKRDFTGMDCNAWVYDLFRPDEPYTARGPHPSGTGIDRYISYDDLSAGEKSYIRRQFWLSLLNLVDPFLIGKTRFRWDENTTWNATLRHHLTPFGNSIDLNVFIQRDALNVLAIAHSYNNYQQTFPGIDVQIWRYPVTFAAIRLHASPRLALWLQPENFGFKTGTPEPGGLAALTLTKRVTGNWEVFAEGEVKTKGWVAGNAYLDRQWAVRGGFNYLLTAY